MVARAQSTRTGLCPRSLTVSWTVVSQRRSLMDYGTVLKAMNRRKASIASRRG